MENKTIKMIQTPEYFIELTETPSSRYLINFENKETGNVVQSESMRDFGIALRLFDLKLQELQGH